MVWTKHDCAGRSCLRCGKIGGTMKIRIRRLAIPTLFCLAVACLIEIPLSETTIFGVAVILWDTLFRAILAVPILFYFYQEDRVFRGAERWGFKDAAVCILIGAVLSAAAAFLTAALGMPDARAAEQTLFAGDLWLQALVLLVASPLLEELFFRGVLYGRLKELFPDWSACLISAAAFGLFHGNMVQGIYGFVMGVVLALAMEWCQTVKAPVLIHFAANGAALVLNLAGFA